MDALLFYIIAASLFLGWGVGSNDAASAVGTPLGAGTITHRRAIAIVVVFSALGFMLQGHNVSNTVGGGILPREFFTENGGAVLAALAAASAVTVLTVLMSLPISVNHALVGAIVGLGLTLGTAGRIDYGLLLWIAACWLTTPLIALVLTVALHRCIVTPLTRNMSWIAFSSTFKFLSVAGAALVSYNLGASAIGSILGLTMSSKINGLFNAQGQSSMQVMACLIALAFGLGVLTFSGRVIRTLGSRITLLGPATAFSAQLGAAVTVYFFVLLGLPASITHAVVGGIAGVGLLKRTGTINLKTLGSIAFGWMVTPLFSALLAIWIYRAII
jgi:PiT family inorganic phosphate transporter